MGTKGLWFFLSLVTGVLSTSNSLLTEQYLVDTVDVLLAENVSFTLNNSVEYLFLLRNETEALDKEPPRLSITCNNCSTEFPLLVVVRRQKEVLSWELPLLVESNSKTLYNSTARTLCPGNDEKLHGPWSIPDEAYLNTKFSFLDQHKMRDTEPDVVISVSTSSPQNIIGSLIVTLQTDFTLSLNKSRTSTVTPSTPIYYSYKFPDENKTSSVLLRVDSDDDVCMTVSVQNLSCPVFDLERNVEFDGYWQTVTRRGGITLTKSMFPLGFFVVFVVNGVDTECSKTTITNRTKTVTFSLKENVSVEDYIVAVTVALVILAAFYVVSITISAYYAFKVKVNVPQLDDEEEATEQASVSFQRRGQSYPQINSPTTPMTEDTLSTGSSIDETDWDECQDAHYDKNIVRSKSFLHVSDLARKNSRVLTKKSQLYLYNLMTVAVFYFLPVVQLVITYQYVVFQTGNQDLCYYNFLCAHPLGFISDFNHVFSNAAYILLGLLFVGLTFRRERMHKRAIALKPVLETYYGIPQHYGLFYAMGVALIMEGVLSGCYHVCPNHSNFQFDTSFMYVISTMCILKIYQTRHPDVNANAYATFGVLAAIIFLGMSGVLWGTPPFWYAFTVLHLSFCFFYSFQVYYMAKVKFDIGMVKRIWNTIIIELRSRSCQFLWPNYPSRLLLLILANACNWGLAILGPKYLDDFATFLLAIFMANLMLYYLFYIVMKMVHKEKIGSQPCIYIILSFLAWGASGYFFFNKSISWKKTPAQSRLYNQPCKLLDFYDNHDIWHFTSAISMFLSFMVLLTLDDDLMYVHRTKIPVF